MNDYRVLAMGSGIRAREPFDVGCAQCGEVLLQAVMKTGPWAVSEPNRLVINGVEHRCSGVFRRGGEFLRLNMAGEALSV